MAEKEEIVAGPGRWDFIMAFAEGGGLPHQRRYLTFTTKGGEKIDVILNHLGRLRDPYANFEYDWSFEGLRRDKSEFLNWHLCQGQYFLRTRTGWIMSATHRPYQTIRVCRDLDRFRAELVGDPARHQRARTPEAAVGQLLRSYPDLFDVCFESFPTTEPEQEG